MLISVTFLFLDLWGIYPKWLGKTVIGLQYAPAFVKTFTVVGWSTVVVLVLSFITLLFGRLYCSHICPLGIYQDFVSFIRKRITRKKVLFKPRKAQNYWRFGILSIVIISFLAGFSLFLNILEPYSNFGKIVSNLVRPAFFHFNNILANWFNSKGNYTFFSVTFGKINWLSVAWAGVFGIIVSVLSFLHGRLFCNLICPVGSFLGLLSKFSLFKLQFDNSKCNNCARCSLACKSECIDIKNKKVDFTRCVGCFNCTTACQNNAMKYKFSYCKSTEKEQFNKELEDNSRRDFLKKSIVTVAGAVFAVKMAKAATTGAGRKNEGHHLNHISHKRNFPVTPPGSQSIVHFTELCTACHICVSTCPTGVLRPSLFDYGIKGSMQPHMDFSSSFCNYECTHCSSVCPTGAIIPIPKEQKKITQMGFVRFEVNNCVVKLDETSCGACAEHCPTSAVKMIHYKDDLTIPSINTNICIGCGACEHACPAKPNKAIWVEGNPVHRKASLPQEKALETKQSDDFPF
jgi:ferredoxin